jgi:hypothetical protein
MGQKWSKEQTLKFQRTMRAKAKQRAAAARATTSIPLDTIPDKSPKLRPSRAKGNESIQMARLNVALELTRILRTLLV